jgi:hypothetical protein
MGIAQIVLLCLHFFGLGIVLIKDGKETVHSFGVSCVAMVLLYSILFWGGWFAV